MLHRWVWALYLKACENVKLKAAHRELQKSGTIKKHICLCLCDAEC